MAEQQILEVKPGYKTSEFIIMILTNVGVVTATLAGNLPGKWAVICGIISTCAYSISRGLAKL